MKAQGWSYIESTYLRANQYLLAFSCKIQS